MTPSIKRAIARLAKAEANMRAVAKAEQKKCKHKEVLQMPWRSGEWLGPHKGRRICMTCGLEQEGESFGDQDYQYSKLKTKGFHRTMTSSEEFFSYRLPCTDAHTP